MCKHETEIAISIYENNESDYIDFGEEKRLLTHEQDPFDASEYYDDSLDNLGEVGVEDVDDFFKGVSYSEYTGKDCLDQEMFLD